MLRELQTERISINFHHFCLTPDNFTRFYISASLLTSSSSQKLQLLLSHSENSIRCRISLKIFICNQRSISVLHNKLETSLYLMVRYGMERFWNPLSVNWDMHGLKYISTIEVRNAFFFSQKETKSDTGQPLQSPLQFFHFYIYTFVGKKISVCRSPVPS